MEKEIDYYEEHIGNDDYDIEYLIMNPFLKHWDRIFQKTMRCDEMIHRSATRHVESMKQLIDQA